MRQEYPRFDSQDFISVGATSTRQGPRVKIDMAVAVLCSALLCLSTARAMVVSQWSPTSADSAPAVSIRLDNPGDELFLKASTIEISTPMVVHSV